MEIVGKPSNSVSHNITVHKNQFSGSRAVKCGRTGMVNTIRRAKMRTLTQVQVLWPKIYVRIQCLKFSLPTAGGEADKWPVTGAFSSCLNTLRTPVIAQDIKY
jgi:hypothetical protein